MNEKYIIKLSVKQKRVQYVKSTVLENENFRIFDKLVSFNFRLRFWRMNKDKSEIRSETK